MEAVLNRFKLQELFSMKNNMIETVMGAVVIAVAALFIYFAYDSAQFKAIKGYTITAKFDRVDGLTPGCDVRMGGVKIGTVTSLDLDHTTFLAVVTMDIKPDLDLPSDTSAEIVSESLLGGKFVALVPGGDDETIPAGGEVKYTQASVNLEALIGQFIFSGQDEGESDKGDD